MARLSDVTDPSYLQGLEEWPLDVIRSRRDETTEIETGLSYLRRIVQGRLDIVLAAQHRRQSGQDERDASHLVDDLPSILGDHVHAPGLGRLPTAIGPGEIDPDLEAELEAVLPAERLASLGSESEERLEGYIHALADMERSLSVQRHAAFDVIDRLQEEIVRRYRTGEATVDTLLS